MRCDSDGATVRHEIDFSLEHSILLYDQSLALFTVLVGWRHESLQSSLTGVDHFLCQEEISDHLFITGQGVQHGSW